MSEPRYDSSDSLVGVDIACQDERNMRQSVCRAGHTPNMSVVDPTNESVDDRVKNESQRSIFDIQKEADKLG